MVVVTVAVAVAVADAVAPAVVALGRAQWTRRRGCGDGRCCSWVAQRRLSGTGVAAAGRIDGLLFLGVGVRTRMSERARRGGRERAPTARARRQRGRRYARARRSVCDRACADGLVYAVVMTAGGRALATVGRETRLEVFQAETEGGLAFFSNAPSPLTTPSLTC